jgi:ligand-binding SRPBCC domain-containing protein
VSSGPPAPRTRGVHVIKREQLLPEPLERAFGFFADALNLEAITPPWLGFRVITPGKVRMGEGALIEYRLRLRGMPIRWLTRIELWDPPRRFVDVQVRGPYRLWRHLHEFEAAGPAATTMRDEVSYSIGYGPLGRLAHGAFVRRDLARIFEYRRDAVARRLGAPCFTK